MLRLEQGIEPLKLAYVKPHLVRLNGISWTQGTRQGRLRPRIKIPFPCSWRVGGWMAPKREAFLISSPPPLPFPAPCAFQVGWLHLLHAPPASIELTRTSQFRLPHSPTLRRTRCELHLRALCSSTSHCCFSFFETNLSSSI